MIAPKLQFLLSRRLVKYCFAALAIILIAAAGWWVSGQKVWTDGQSGPHAIRVSTASEEPRQVLWSPSRAVLTPHFTGDHLYEPALSPDGTELFFVRGKAGLALSDTGDDRVDGTGADIYVSRRRNAQWLPPEKLNAVSSRYDDLGPRITADGRFLLFYSNRLGGQGGYDLWAASRNDDGVFGEPFNLGAGVNSAFDEYGPAPTADTRHLYFSTNRTAAGKEQHTAWRATIRAASTSDFDLWSADLAKVATKPGDATAPPILQATAAREVPGVNTPFHEGAPCLSPFGDFLYFASNRPEGHGRFDLYRSRLMAGTPREAENLGPSVNTADNETDPHLAHGGFRLCYSSDREAAHDKAASLGDGVARSPVDDVAQIAEAAPSFADASSATTLPSRSTTQPVPPLPDHASRPYALYEADSREVYPERQGRPLPVIGWATLAMIVGALLLLPLLFLLVRSLGRLNVTLLQRCFLAALCVYALFLLWTTSKHVVMEAYPQLAKDLGLIEVKINLDPRIEEANVAMAIRQQSTNNLPIAAAPPGQLTQQMAGGEAIEAAPDVAVNVPQAAVGGDAMSVILAPLKMELPKTAVSTPAAVVTPVAAPAPQAVDIRIDVGPRLQQAEAAPVVQLAPAPVAVQAPFAPQPVGPAAVAMPELPAVQPVTPTGSFVESTVPAVPRVPQVETPGTAIAAAASSATASPAITLPAPAGAKALAVEPATPQASVQIAPTIERLAGLGAAGAAPAADVSPAIPSGGAELGGATQSLAAAPGVGAILNPHAISGLAGVAASLPAGELLRDPEVAGPKMPTVPLAGGEPQTPTIGPAQALGMSRQNVPIGELAGGAGIRDTQLPKTPTTGGGGASLLAGAPGTSTVAHALARITAPRADVKPDPAAAVATSAGVAGVTVHRPTARPSAIEPSLADAAGVVGAVGGVLQPTTRPVAASPAATATLLPMTPIAGPGVDTGATSIAAASTTQPISATFAAAGVQVAEPTEVGPSAPIAASNLQLSVPRPAAAPVATVKPEIELNSIATAKPVKLDPAIAAQRSGESNGIVTTTPMTPSVQSVAGSSTASSAVVAPRTVVVAPAVPTPSIAGTGMGQQITGVDGPQMSLPKIATGVPGAGAGAAQGLPTGAGHDGKVDGTTVAAVRADTSHLNVDRPMAIAPVGVPGATTRTGKGGIDGPVAISGPRPSLAAAPGVDIAPSIVITSPRLGAPEALFQRSAEQRRPMIEKLGGTKESEDAVARGLAWLSRNQEADGRWTYISSSGKKSRSKSQGVHDMGVTGLAILAFLAADHSPTKEGPYQQVVASGVDWLVSQQTDDGDLRGAKNHRGAGAGRANMYDHGIATMAVAEAALMTGDRRYIDAAYKAAQYICDTQHKKTGGWRYLPGESGDTSVFGWQILALHNAELLGFQTPAEVRERSLRYLSLVSSGKTKILASYIPGQGASQPMTAEALFCRVLLEEPISDAQAKEVVEYLGREPPKKNNVDLYYWYYASLSMAQLQANPQVRVAWDKWNERCRDTLIATQARNGDQDGSWMDNRWGEQGGKVYSTALATLTLEVYYRYLPLEGLAPAPVAAPVAPAVASPKKVRPRGPVGPKLEPN